MQTNDPTASDRVLVRKYGGSSLASPDRIKAVARDILACRNKGCRMVVVVSAMGRTTDELSGLAHSISDRPARRELDMLLSVGERITMSLLTMALTDLGCASISFTGSQCGLITDGSHTDARILEVRCDRVRDALEAGNVVVVAGFQGVSRDREITTLGRGGSDVTAVALAAALDAERCEILKDVDGVFTGDPHLIDTAVRHDHMTYDQMEAVAEAGCGVIHPNAVEFAKRLEVPLFISSSFRDGPGTIIEPDSPAAPARSADGSPRPLGLVLRRDVALAPDRDAAGPRAGISIAFSDGSELETVPPLIEQALRRAERPDGVVLTIGSTIHVLLPQDAAESMLQPLHDLFLS